MAAIDKTYGTPGQSAQMYHWMKRCGTLRYHYGLDWITDQDEVAVINTPTWLDKFHARFCPFRFVLERIVDVYSADSKLVKICKQRLASTTSDHVPTYRTLVKG